MGTDACGPVRLTPVAGHGKKAVHMTKINRREIGISLCCVVLALVTGCKSGGEKSSSKKPAMKPAAEATVAPKGVTVYVGTYTNPKNGSKGIYKLSFDEKTGTLGKPEVAGETKNPSFLATSPDENYLYSVGEVDDVDGQKGGAVHSFSIEKDGTLKLISTVSSGGAGPCYVSIDASGRNVFVANYSGGSISRIVAGDNGKLIGPMATIEFEGSGPNKQRQEKPHAHMIAPDPGNNFVLATDLGTDKVMLYRLDLLKGLIPTDPPTVSLKPGSGPRHFAFSKDSKFVFVICELSNSITTFSYDAMECVLKEVGSVSAVPDDFKGSSTCAQIVVHPSGKYVYGSNRGSDTIGAYSIDEATGKLTLIGFVPSGGKQPRNFNIDPTGNYLIAAHQSGNSLVLFKIDQATGKLTDTGTKIEIPAPVCVLFVK